MNDFIKVNLKKYLHTEQHFKKHCMRRSLTNSLTRLPASPMQHSTAQYNTVQFSTIQYSTMQYYTVKYNKKHKEVKMLRNSRTSPVKSISMDSWTTIDFHKEGCTFCIVVCLGAHYRAVPLILADKALP